MNNIISLDGWKKQKLEEEVDELSKRVSDMIEELDIDKESVAGSYFTEVTGYNNLGLPISTVLLEPTISSCTSALAWVSYVLVGLGEKDAAAEIDAVVEKLEAVSK